MAKETVCVVIPFFNGSRWVKRALESVFSQTRLPDEVIVVNDGSTSDEAGFLQLLLKSFDFRIIDQENRGQSSARNLGISESRSDYICLLDQDDYFLPRHIEQLLAISDIENPMFSFAYGDLHRVTEADELMATSCIHVKTQHPLTSLEVMLRNNMYILPSATLIKKSSFLEIGGFDEDLRGFEDDDLFIRFFVKGFTSSFTTDAVSAWTINGESTSYSEAMSRSRFLYFSKLYRAFVLGAEEKPKELSLNFSGLLFARFSPNFANDVVSSALSGGEYFLERVKRLKSFRGLVLRDKGIKLIDKFGYLIGTLPLATLPESTQRVLLRLLLATLEASGGMKNGLLSEFVRINSTKKKSVS